MLRSFGDFTVRVLRRDFEPVGHITPYPTTNCNFFAPNTVCRSLPSLPMCGRNTFRGVLQPTTPAMVVVDILTSSPVVTCLATVRVLRVCWNACGCTGPAPRACFVTLPASRRVESGALLSIQDKPDSVSTRRAFTLPLAFSR